MKYVYVVLKEYDNNVCQIEQVFTSKKKADLHLEYLARDVARYPDSNYTVEYDDYRYFDGNKVQALTLRHQNYINTQRYYLLKERVA